METLALSYTDLAGRVGDYLGYGYGSDNGDQEWDDAQLRDIHVVLKRGQSKFYFPPIVPGQSAAYQWSFIRPVVQRTLAESTNTLDLPEEFADFCDGVTIISTSGAYLEVPVGNVGQIMALESELPSFTGQPRLVAVEPMKRSNSNDPPKRRLRVFPTADADYTLSFQMVLAPDCFSATRPFPYGGASHGGTMEAACLAAAEFLKDQARGVCYAEFMESLASSISRDKQVKAQTYGQNLDQTEGQPLTFPRFNTITIDGVTPS